MSTKRPARIGNPDLRQQKHVKEPMLLEAFGLKQVYVPLHTYYKQKVTGEKSEEFERRMTEDEKYQRVVLDLKIELEA